MNKDCRIWIEMQENWKFIQILLCWIYFAPFLEFSFKILLFDKSLNINWVPLFYVHLSHYLCILIEFMLFGFFVLPNGWVGYGRHLVIIFMQKKGPYFKSIAAKIFFIDWWHHAQQHPLPALIWNFLVADPSQYPELFCNKKESS